MLYIKLYEDFDSKDYGRKYWMVKRLPLNDFAVALWKLGIPSGITNRGVHVDNKYMKGEKYVLIGCEEGLWSWDPVDSGTYKSDGLEYKGLVVITDEDRSKYEFEKSVERYNL